MAITPNSSLVILVTHSYYMKKDSEKIEIFRKIEPYITFLNVYEIERQGADIQTKIGVRTSKPIIWGKRKI